jgi:MerR family transcriptional regulator, thiopeptide resistance regulator
MQSRRHYQVKEVAEHSGVSIRALHHYDAIGLLVPRLRSAAGYRLYSEDDLLRLQQILIGRALGLPLEEIRRSLDDPAFDRRRALLEQREALTRRAEQMSEMLHAIDAAIAVLDGTSLDDDGNQREGKTVDYKKLFNGFDPSKYEDEVKQRWGNTEAYKASEKRAKSYTEEDWKRCMAEQGTVYADAVAALKAGTAPTDPAVMDIAERHRLAIDRWFYPCSTAMHCRLADGYESDDRFRSFFEGYAAGLTAFLSAAIRANAQRAVK